VGQERSCGPIGQELRTKRSLCLEAGEREAQFFTPLVPSPHPSYISIGRGEVGSVGRSYRYCVTLDTRTQWLTSYIYCWTLLLWPGIVSDLPLVSHSFHTTA
jgi:hypothetical protein